MISFIDHLHMTLLERIDKGVTLEKAIRSYEDFEEFISVLDDAKMIISIFIEV
jgi:hypothetical protein